MQCNVGDDCGCVMGILDVLAEGVVKGGNCDLGVAGKLEAVGEKWEEGGVD